MNKQNQSKINELQKKTTLEISRKHTYIHTYKQLILYKNQKDQKVHQTPQKIHVTGSKFRHSHMLFKKENEWQITPRQNEREEIIKSRN